jgi:hypothetical protein
MHEIYFQEKSGCLWKRKKTEEDKKNTKKKTKKKKDCAEVQSTPWLGHTRLAMTEPRFTPLSHRPVGASSALLASTGNVVVVRHKPAHHGLIASACRKAKE